MSPDDFRRIALAQPGAVEGAHMGHADFRADGRVFASLGHPDAAWGMVKLAPEEQALLVEAEPDGFRPANGAWGRQGSTLVRLEAVDEATLASALGMARRATERRPGRPRPRAKG